jgi:hypothetical protein
MMIEDHDNKTRVKTRSRLHSTLLLALALLIEGSVLVRHSRYGIPVDLQY